MESTDSTPSPMALLAIAGTVIAGGALIGASTNAINGVISPLYFQVVMGWQDVESIWRASIAQGIFEGLIYRDYSPTPPDFSVNRSVSGVKSACSGTPYT